MFGILESPFHTALQQLPADAYSQVTASVVWRAASRLDLPLDWLAPCPTVMIPMGFLLARIGRHEHRHWWCG